MAKTRVGVILREQMGTTGSNKNADLAKLTADYNVWCKKIHHLIQALKGHLASLQQIEKSRLELAKSFAAFTKETPLFDCIGLMPSEDRPASTVCSFRSIHEDLGAKMKSFSGKYQQFVLDYAIEWEKVVRTRIDNGLKKAEETRRDLDHYQKKVESLRQTNNTNMVKGKSVGASQQEKLQRNEQKFMQAKQNYNKVATDLVILMEEVNERSWRDLHPLLIKASQFDMTLSSDEAKSLASLERVVSVLKQIANEKGISPQPRLKDLGSLKPELISTRPGGVAGLQIEYSGSPTAAPIVTGGAFGETALAPGSVGPQGLGGFPVALSPTSNDIQRATSFTSTQSQPIPSMNALAITTSPAPTFDDSYSSGYMPSTIQTTGSAFPAPLSHTSNYRRVASFDDAASAYSGYSGYSGYSAPPPVSAPPPPPSMPPPMPPTPSGSYGLPPMAPTSSFTKSMTVDPYASLGNNNAATSSFSSSPWSAPNNSPTNQNQFSNPNQNQFSNTNQNQFSNPNPLSMYGNPPPLQQPPQPQFASSGTPQSNPGYNPFGN